MLEIAHQDFEEHEGASRVTTFRRPRGEVCDDLSDYPPVVSPAEPQCQRCLDEDLRWVALRTCLACGAVGCCDSSPGQHATAHFRDSAHPVIQSAEPGEDWRWCYKHHLTA
jgi:CPA1 family monovalent cation:H+ antiporter